MEGYTLKARNYKRVAGKLHGCRLGGIRLLRAFMHALPLATRLAGLRSTATMRRTRHVVQENTRIFGISHASTGAIFSAFFPPRPWRTNGGGRQKADAGYAPIQSIAYEFGSKAMSGYFVPQGSVCLVTLMISDKIDPDRPSPATASLASVLCLNPVR